jgi:hypothetical protein
MLITILIILVIIAVALFIWRDMAGRLFRLYKRGGGRVAKPRSCGCYKPDSRSRRPMRGVQGLVFERTSARYRSGRLRPKRWPAPSGIGACWLRGSGGRSDAEAQRHDGPVSV